MCGIAGIFSYGPSPRPVEAEELLRIREAMHRRGPDGEGLWISADARVGLAHRRLSIIDLSPTGAQPMSTPDGRLHITYNGEIYNYRELRRQLEVSGSRFISSSDTEVLLHLYRRHGADMVHKLRGMFAFAIYDSLDRSLFLARDPFGIKPVYFSDDGHGIRFASQVKALLKSSSIDTQPSAAGHVGFFVWGHVPDPHTLYRGISALPAGSTLHINARGLRNLRRYFRVADEFAAAADEAASLTVPAKREALADAVVDSVRHHLVADVPVGVFLSSGMDSTTLTAVAMQVASGDLRTITLGFDEYRGTHDDETPLASLVAARYGSSHQTQWVSKGDFLNEMPEMLEAMDQPSIDGVNTYFVSRAAARAGMKVAMSGIGGDELLGGYPSFRDVPLMARLLHAMPMGSELGIGARKMLAPLIKRMTSPKYASLLEFGGSYSGAYLLRRGLYMPWELPEFIDREFVDEGWEELVTLLRLEETIRGLPTPYAKVSSLELSWYMRNQLLRDSDWAGMAHSLEIRTPLVDVEFFRRVAPLIMHGELNKKDMVEVPRIPLPARVSERRKTGFSIPVRDWVRKAGDDPRLARGIRGWARKLDSAPAPKKRLLVLVTDAFGGHGGISKFNRDFLEALCNDPATREVVAIPRLMPSPPGELPAKLTYVTNALNSKAKYVWRLVRLLAGGRGFDLVICGHINLVPIAWLARTLSGNPLVLIVHGIDAWQRTIHPLTNFLAARVDAFISVSRLTMDRLVAWTGLTPSQGYVLPNSVDLRRFEPAPKDAGLLDQLGLSGKPVIMTMGRLVSAERYKGFDEVMESLPGIAREVPDVRYVIAGEGDDRKRLEQKATSLGLRDRVVFTGFVPEDRKRDYYNLADAFVMPSRGEGFGIVFLEAMACGIPVVGSTVDGSREALRGGELGALVDPGDSAAVTREALAALRRPKAVPEGLHFFSNENFEKRVHKIVSELSAHNRSPWRQDAAAQREVSP